MASFNEVLLLGNLTKDPVISFLSSGTQLCKFGLAVNRKYKSGEDWKEDVCFVDITVWGNQGENCAKYLTKGQSVFIRGRLQFHQWETDDGQRRSKLDVVAENVQFLSSPTLNNQGGDDSIPF